MPSLFTLLSSDLAKPPNRTPLLLLPLPLVSLHVRFLLQTHVSAYLATSIWCPTPMAACLSLSLAQTLLVGEAPVASAAPRSKQTALDWDLGV